MSQSEFLKGNHTMSSLGASGRQPSTGTVMADVGHGSPSCCIAASTWAAVKKSPEPEIKNALPMRFMSLAFVALTSRQSMEPTEGFIASIAAMKGSDPAADGAFCASTLGHITQT